MVKRVVPLCIQCEPSIYILLHSTANCQPHVGSREASYHISLSSKLEVHKVTKKQRVSAFLKDEIEIAMLYNYLPFSNIEMSLQILLAAGVIWYRNRGIGDLGNVSILYALENEGLLSQILAHVGT